MPTHARCRLATAAITALECARIRTISIMRYQPINPQMFINHRTNLSKLLLPNSLAVLNANDILPTNADGTMALHPNSDLFYLTGVEQEETILLLYPEAHEENMREVLFLRETNDLIATWEG